MHWKIEKHQIKKTGSISPYTNGTKTNILLHPATGSTPTHDSIRTLRSAPNTCKHTPMQVHRQTFAHIDALIDTNANTHQCSHTCTQTPHTNANAKCNNQPDNLEQPSRFRSVLTNLLIAFLLRINAKARLTLKNALEKLKTTNCKNGQHFPLHQQDPKATFCTIHHHGQPDPCITRSFTHTNTTKHNQNNQINKTNHNKTNK